MTNAATPKFPELSACARRIAGAFGIILILIGIGLHFSPAHRNAIETSNGVEIKRTTTDADSSTIVIAFLTAGAACFAYGVNGLKIAKLSTGIVNAEAPPDSNTASEQAPGERHGNGPTIGQEDILKFLKGYLQMSSWNGLKVLHICQLADAKSRTFNLRELCQRDQRMSYDYAFGYLVSSASMGLFVHNTDPPATFITVTSFIPIVRTELQVAINTRIPSVPGDKATKEAEISAIEAYFAS